MWRPVVSGNGEPPAGRASRSCGGGNPGHHSSYPMLRNTNQSAADRGRRDGGDRSIARSPGRHPLSGVSTGSDGSGRPPNGAKGLSGEAKKRPTSDSLCSICVRHDRRRRRRGSGYFTIRMRGSSARPERCSPTTSSRRCSIASRARAQERAHQHRAGPREIADPRLRPVHAI